MKSPFDDRRGGRSRTSCRRWADDEEARADAHPLESLELFGVSTLGRVGRHQPDRSGQRVTGRRDRRTPDRLRFPWSAARTRSSPVRTRRPSRSRGRNLRRAGTSGAPNPVKTKSPSDVSGFPSSIPSGVWRKKPFDRCAVTMPAVVTNCPANVEVVADPWMAEIGSVVVCSTATRMIAVAVRVRSSETVAVIVRKPGSPAMLAVHEKYAVVRRHVAAVHAVVEERLSSGKPIEDRSADTESVALGGAAPGVTVTVRSVEPPDVHRSRHGAARTRTEECRRRCAGRAGPPGSPGRCRSCRPRGCTRIAAVAFESVGAGPDPSKQFALVP